MFELSETDTAFYEWLSRLREPEKNKVCIDERSQSVVASFDNPIDAHQALSQQNCLRGLLELKVFVGTELYGRSQRVPKLGRQQSTSGTNETMIDTQVTTQSSWVLANSNVFSSIPGNVAIHSATKDLGYKYLDIKPDMGIEDRLNKPKKEMVGSEIWTISPGIAEPRARHLEIVAASGGTLSYNYDYSWNNLLWRFRVTLCYLSGHDEIMAITEDVESWQRDYWMNYAKNKPAN